MRSAKSPSCAWLVAPLTVLLEGGRARNEPVRDEPYDRHAEPVRVRLTSVNAGNDPVARTAETFLSRTVNRSHSDEIRQFMLSNI